MAIDWKDSPSTPASTGTANPWFAVSIGLIGFILGMYFLPVLLSGASAQGTAQLVAPTPETAQIAAAPAAGGCGCGGGGKGCGMTK